VICRKSPTIFQRVLSISGLLVVTDRCVVLCLMYSRDYLDDDTSTVGHRLHCAFSTDLIFTDDVSTASHLKFFDDASGILPMFTMPDDTPIGRYADALLTYTARVDQTTRCPVRELAYPRVVQLPWYLALEGTSVDYWALIAK